MKKGKNRYACCDSTDIVDNIGLGASEERTRKLSSIWKSVYYYGDSSVGDNVNSIYLFTTPGR